MDMLRSEDEGITLSLTKEEFYTLANCVNETLEAVQDWEFSTRVGVDRSFAVELRSALGNIARSL
ncbi:hypothetical protein ACIRG5_25910 [Lentzea sp. NPDC102401]|uniref:hypothetical protein n=1 Tax=Lentzea sp. NPDC102401 TaxID=3364128 RepID=UPI003810838E